MNNAQIYGFRMIGSRGFDFGPKTTLQKTAEGWEARRGGVLVGICQTREGAKELLNVVDSLKPPHPVAQGIRCECSGCALWREWQRA
jgi:hypothetical protein